VSENSEVKQLGGFWQTFAATLICCLPRKLCPTWSNCSVNLDVGAIVTAQIPPAMNKKRVRNSYSKTFSKDFFALNY